MGEREKLLYDPKEFVCTDVDDYNKYFEEYKQEFGEFKTLLSNFLKDLSLDQLEEECSDNHIKGVNTSQHPYKLSTARFVHLEVNQKALEFKVVQCKEKYFANPRKTYLYPVFKPNPSFMHKLDLNPGEVVIYTIKMYEPFKIKVQEGRKPTHKQRCLMEVNVLGDQTLADLRDKLLCTSDLGVSIEIEYPQLTELAEVSTHEAYPSGFIFIENCFYNDMRHENAIDYSEPIRRSAALNRNSPKFVTSKMETTKLLDIKLRLGYPYLYQHRGDCEHIIVFSDVRLLGNDDDLSRVSYPHIKFQYPFNSVNCFMCGHRVARYLITNSDRIPHKLSYFCRECVLAYNYIGDTKIGTFKLYPYFDRALYLSS